MNSSVLLEQRDAALQEQAERKEKDKDIKRVNNADLHAGSSMHYYCRDCGEEMILLETHSEPAPRRCFPCMKLAKIQEKLAPKDIPTRIKELKQRAPMWAHGGTMKGVRRLRRARDEHERGVNAVLNLCDKGLSLQELKERVRGLRDGYRKYFTKAVNMALTILESYDEETMLLNRMEE